MSLEYFRLVILVWMTSNHHSNMAGRISLSIFQVGIQIKSLNQQFEFPNRFPHIGALTKLNYEKITHCTILKYLLLTEAHFFFIK